MRSYLFLFLLFVSGCAAGGAQRVSIDQVSGDSVCDARALGSFVGQPASTETGRTLMGFSRSHSIRWVPHGGAMTMDHNPRRLTVQLDQQNRIAALNCG